jgi:hypothetical protein
LWYEEKDSPTSLSFFRRFGDCASGSARGVSRKNQKSKERQEGKHETKRMQTKRSKPRTPCLLLSLRSSFVLAPAQVVQRAA